LGLQAGGQWKIVVVLTLEFIYLRKIILLMTYATFRRFL